MMFINRQPTLMEYLLHEAQKTPKDDSLPKQLKMTMTYMDKKTVKDSMPSKIYEKTKVTGFENVHRLLSSDASDENLIGSPPPANFVTPKVKNTCWTLPPRSKSRFKMPTFLEPAGNWEAKPWLEWNKYDCLQWIQVFMPLQNQLNALKANEVDGKKLEELIQFDMEVRRAQRDESSVFPKSPMPGVTWTGVRILSGRFWAMVTEHLHDINTKEYYQ